MNYYLDTEFIEGTQKRTFLGFNIGKTKPTIDLISVGIIAEDSRKYYAISKDFNLKEAWNRYDLKETEHTVGFGYETEKEVEKVYWIRENVLKPIWKELKNKDYFEYNAKTHGKVINTSKGFNYDSLSKLIERYGKTNQQIAEEIIEFCGKDYVSNSPKYQDKPLYGYTGNAIEHSYKKEKPTFYAYYADYDWVVFCWLFGKMNDLPNGFPFYCRDLKQIADTIWETTGKNTKFENPKGEHNALVDAKWNKDFHKFLTTLQK